MSSSISNNFSIFDMSDEIMAKIILSLDSTDRFALGNSHKKFHQLLFENKDLFGTFDCPQKGNRLSLSQIRELLNGKKTRKAILEVNVRYTNCMGQGASISKPTNIVDIKIYGRKCRDVYELRTCLEPLLRLKHLSVDWPPKEDDHCVSRFKDDNYLVQKRSNKLAYLSVTLWDVPSLKKFVRSLKPCTELKELHMVVVTNRNRSYIETVDLIPKELTSLEIVKVSGFRSSLFKQNVISSLPEAKVWTEFQTAKCFKVQSLHLERKCLEICEELQDKKLFESMSNFYQWDDTSKFGRVLLFDCLVKSAIGLIHENAPKEFCCLKLPRDGSTVCALKIDEAKLLLKNPRQLISFIYLNHDIEPECDVHLLAAAFPNLTEIVLSNIIRDEEMIHREEQLPISEAEEPAESATSFKIFISQTPHVKDLTIDAYTNKLDEAKSWDLESLRWISNWKNLRILKLMSIPIRNGTFLIEIGKECTQLETLILYNLGPEDSFCYMNELKETLNVCRKLKDFAIEGSNMGEVSGIFTSITKNIKLEKIRVLNKGGLYTAVNLTNSVKQLIRRCPNLRTFVCIIDQISKGDFEELKTTLIRFKDELNRPSLKFQINWPTY